MKTEVDVLDSKTVSNSPVRSLWTYNNITELAHPSARELCESRGGSPGLPVPNSPYGLCGRKATLNESATELRSCVKVEVDVLELTPNAQAPT